MMNVIIWFVAGGMIGWLTSVMMKTPSQQGIMLNVIVGAIGAALAGWVISPLIGAGAINEGNLSLTSVAVSLVGALILLSIVSLFRRSNVR